MEEKKDIFLIPVDDSSRIGHLTNILAGLIESRPAASRQVIENSLAKDNIPSLHTLAAAIMLSGSEKLSTLAGQSLGAHVRLRPDYIEVEPFPHEKAQVIPALHQHGVPGWMDVRICDVGKSEAHLHPHTNISSEGTEIARIIARKTGAGLA